MLLKLITREQYKGERHYPTGYNFCGSNTNFKERVDPTTLNPYSSSPFKNEIDKACYHHDVEYMKNLEEYNKLCPAQKRQEKTKFQAKNWQADEKLIKDITVI